MTTNARWMLGATGIALLFVSPISDAAPADWTSYLCEYGQYGDRLPVRVNQKDERVQFKVRGADTEASGVKFTDGAITFDGPSGMPLFIARGSGPKLSVTAMTRNGPAQGYCRPVDD